MMKVSSPEQAGSSRKLTRVADAEVLHGTLLLMESQLLKDGVTLDTDLPDELSLLKVFPQQIQQVLVNPISNARYALNQKSPGSHPDKKLAIRAEKNGEGTGIGLSISQGIMRDHGGSVLIENRFGEGRRFVLDFPASEAGGEDGSPAPAD